MSELRIHANRDIRGIGTEGSGGVEGSGVIGGSLIMSGRPESLRPVLINNGAW
ncbi:MAG: hypothetical protein IPI00_05240 [Flavobacteriales bacterium]|nr:hypothetical protein [Flavobacteriales bacterium]MBK6945230.1 hypothetical protein [Flavobacteriales bacterium]MBK7239579.1 hypothetical protein [Flavobacteriales bacterium]MBK7296129.1 hypothetical protein [Flavobacteriales bacterium]MBK9535214.1 hypothetical protein [Flavobacteriales bacterium]